MAQPQQTHLAPPASPIILDEKDVKPSEVAHLDWANETADVKVSVQREDAMRAEGAEHNISLGQSLRVYRRAILWSMAISLVIVMDGYDTGVLSSVAGLPPFRMKYGKPAAKGYQLTAAWQTAITEAPIVGNILGIFVSSWFQDRYGYRRTIQIFLVFLTGVIFMVFFAPTIEILFVGLMLCGMPWGAFSSSAVSYASEVTPLGLRGYLTTYVNLCWVIGNLLASGVMSGVSSRTDQWAFRIPFAVQWVWPIPLFILATLAPESPWFYVRKGRLEEAEKSVSRLAKEGDDTNPSDIVAMMVRTNEVEKANQPGTNYWDCFKGTDLRRTEIACIGWACQALAGTPFANNPVYFLQQAGFSTQDSFNFGVGAKALAFVGTCGSYLTIGGQVAVSLIRQYFGRRPVMVWGLLSLSLVLFSIGATGCAPNDNLGAKWASGAMCLLWVFIYDFTVGPLAYAVVGESSSTRLRSKTVGLARNTYNVFKIVGALIYTYQVNPTAWNWAGKAGFFWGGTAFIAFSWAYFRLPEFKNRSFRELDVLFNRRIPARKFKETVVAQEDEE